MGYTHYFEQIDPPSDEQWNNITQKFKELYAIGLILGPLPIQQEDDDASPPTFNEEQIRFNGIGRDAHDTFLIKKDDLEFAFCKTARKPYDFVVTATLLLVHHYAPYCYSISSDGACEDWEAGQQLLKEYLNLSVEIPERIPAHF